MSDPVELVINHLQSVLSNGTSFDNSIVERADTKLSLDNSLLVNDAISNNDTIVKSLLPLLIAVLKTPLQGVNYDSVVSLLSTTLSHKSYSEVINFISQQDLIEGLRSGVPHLQIACINQIIKADPPDALANTQIILVLVELLASSPKDVQSDVIYSVHKALVTLSSFGDLIRRRLFSGDCLSILQTKLHNGDSILQARLMNLITEVLQFDKSPPNQYIPSDLITFPPDSIDKDDDVLLVLNKIQFYRDIISNPHPPTLISTISPQIERIAALYSKLKNDPVMESFLLNEIFTFFGILSSTYLPVFRELDIKYQITAFLTPPQVNFNNESTNMFLSLLSPKYIFEYLPETISQVPLKPHCIRVLRNLVKFNQSYQLLISTPSSPLSDQNKIIEQLPYLELMALLVPISATVFGTNHLLTSPKLMDAILFKDDVRDTDSVSYRREVLQNLVKIPPQTLGVWSEPVRSKYREVVHGVVENEPQAIVADESAS